MLGLIVLVLSELVFGGSITQVPQHMSRKVPVLISGEMVMPGSGWDHVVSILTGNAGCTATVVGKRVIVTAAHCAGNGSTSKFQINGKSYQAKMTRSSLYPKQDHDIAFGVTDTDIDVAHMASVNVQELKQGDKLTILGYGCTQPGGGGGDGKLRKGEAVIVNFSQFDAVSSNGAALCFGDSGGPQFVKVGEAYKIAAINSKGNIKDTNYGARLEMQQSKDFITKFVSVNNVQICGINVDCDGGPPPIGLDFTMKNPVATLQMHVNNADDLDYVKRMAEWFMKHIGNEK